MIEFPTNEIFNEKSHLVQNEIKKCVELPTETIDEITSRVPAVGKFGPELVIELAEENGNTHKVWCPKNVRLALEKYFNIDFFEK